MLYYKLLVILFSMLVSLSNAWANTCYKNAYGRGVGIVPNECPKGQVKSGLLCYEMPQGKLANDFNVIAGVAWAKCKWGNDGGTFCSKIGDYGRGAGYALWDKDKCFRENAQGCEQNGALFYPKCAGTHHPVGCCICSPNCPPNTTDIGALCNKETFVMPPKPATCKLDQDMDAGLCYNKCNKNTKGIGPVCWGTCPEGMVDCGAICASSSEECGQVIVKQVLSLASLALKIGAAIKNPTAVIGTIAEGISATKLSQAEAEKYQVDQLKEKAKEVRNAILDEVGVGISVNEFKKRVKERLQEELSAKGLNLNPYMLEQLAETASRPEEKNAKKLVDTIASYDKTGLGIGEVLKAFNLDQCLQ